MPKTVCVLIGPKGSGKTFVGRLAERRFGARFVDVEALFLALPADARQGYSGYQRVEEELEKALRDGGIATIELTGASPHMAKLLSRLKTRYNLRLVRLFAPLETCLERIDHRDTALHLPTTEDLVRKVHEISSSLKLEFDLTIDNTDLSEGELESLLRGVLGQVQNP